MKKKIENHEKYALLSIEEEKLDTTHAADLKATFSELAVNQNKYLIVNLQAVKYVDSSALSALLVGNRMFSEVGCFVLYGIQDHVQKLIKISMLDKVLNLLPSKEEAVDFILMTALENEMKNEEEE